MVCAFFPGKGGGCRLFRAIDIGRRNNKVEGYVYGYTHGSMDRFAFKIIANIFKRVDSAYGHRVYISQSDISTDSLFTG